MPLTPFLEVRLREGNPPLSPEMLQEVQRIIAGLTNPVRDGIDRLHILLTGPSPLGFLDTDFNPDRPEDVAYVATSCEASASAQEKDPAAALRLFLECVQNLDEARICPNTFAAEHFAMGQPLL